MAPLGERFSIRRRYIDHKENTVEPFKKYYILAEGEKSEIAYFHALKNSLHFNIRSEIEVIVLERTENDVHNSNPKKLYNQMLRLNRNAEDEYVIVFDSDIYKTTLGYHKILEDMKNQNIRPIVTSPCIELWYILHVKDSLNDHVLPSKEEIFANEKISSKHRFTSKMCQNLCGFNPKNTFKIELIKNIKHAVKQAESLESDMLKLNTTIGTNIHLLIVELLEDNRFT